MQTALFLAHNHPNSSVQPSRNFFSFPCLQNQIYSHTLQYTLKFSIKCKVDFDFQTPLGDFNGAFRACG